MLGIGERTYCTFDVLPTTLIVERASNRCRDERAPLTLTDPAVESLDDFVIQAYVQTHGHTLSHTQTAPVDCNVATELSPSVKPPSSVSVSPSRSSDPPPMSVTPPTSVAPDSVTLFAIMTESDGPGTPLPPPPGPKTTLAALAPT